MLVSFGVSGHAALSHFLARCGMVRTDYMQCLDRKQDNSILWIDSCWKGYENPSQKALAIMHKETFFMLVRDPISRIKSIVNHGGFKNRLFENNITFNMDTKPCVVLDRHGYRDIDDTTIHSVPIINSQFINHMLSNVWSFAYYSNISHLPLDSNITYLDMQELMPNKAFDTITKLAHEFGFTPPKNEDRSFYEEIKYGEFSYILPLICEIVLHDTTVVCIHISTKYAQCEKNIIDILFETYHPLLDKVSFSMSESDLKALQEDKETLSKVKSYMQDFLIELHKRTEFIKQNKKHETDVLNIFQNDRDLYYKVKTMLDKELIHIKTHRPDIVASWKYYQEFEKIYNA